MKTLLVTGATSGFGAAIVERFVGNDWRAIATGRRQDRLDALADRLGRERVHTACFDMRDADAMAAALDAIPAPFRDLDLLVNNAGLALGTAPAQACDLAQWRQMIDTNVTALVAITHRLLPALIERRGAIVNIGSIAGVYPYPGGNVYGATKAFVDQFSLNLRSDLHGTGVRVSVIEPGLAETEFTLVRTGGDQAASDALYAGTAPITAADIAESTWWIANLPPHLNINRLEVMPVSQSLAGLQVHREPVNPWLAMLAIVAIGAMLPLQGLVNARLAGALHGPVMAAFVSFLVGSLVLGAWLLAARTPWGATPDARFPAWIWIGGVLGAVYVAVFTLLIPRVGAAAAICLAVLGQVVASLLLDHYGVLQAQRPADWSRIAGAVLVLLGVLLVAAPWKAPPAA